MLFSRAVPVRERGDGRLGARLERASLLLDRDREPACEHERDERSDEVDDPGADPDGAGAERVRQDAGRGHRQAEDGVVRAHDRRERAAPVLVGCASLDEQPVADDDGAVPRGAADHERDGEPDRAAERGGTPPDSHQQQRADIRAPQADLAECRRAQEAPECQADAARRHQCPEADVAGVESVLREDDLSDVDRGRSDQRDVPDDENGPQRPGGEDEPKAVRDVAPVTAGERILRTKPTLGDPRDERGGEDERDGIDGVRDRRPPRRDQEARDDRPDHPREGLDGHDERVRVDELLLGHEVRDRSVRGRKEEAGRDAGDRRERDETADPVDERQRGEHAEADEVGGDNQPAAREAVDERAEQEADDDDREEVRDEQGRDPDAGFGRVVDLQRERDGGEIRPEARPCGGEEEVSECR